MARLRLEECIGAVVITRVHQVFGWRKNILCDTSASTSGTGLRCGLRSIHGVEVAGWRRMQKACHLLAVTR